MVFLGVRQGTEQLRKCLTPRLSGTDLTGVAAPVRQGQAGEKAVMKGVKI